MDRIVRRMKDGWKTVAFRVSEQEIYLIGSHMIHGRVVHILPANRGFVALCDLLST